MLEVITGRGSASRKAFHSARAVHVRRARLRNAGIAVLLAAVGAVVASTPPPVPVFGVPPNTLQLVGFVVAGLGALGAVLSLLDYR